MCNKSKKIKSASHYRIKTDPISTGIQQSFLNQACSMHQHINFMKTYHQGFYKMSGSQSIGPCQSLQKFSSERYQSSKKRNNSQKSGDGQMRKFSNSPHQKLEKMVLKNSISDGSCRIEPKINNLNLRELMRYKVSCNRNQVNKISRNPFYKIQKRRYRPRKNPQPTSTSQISTPLINSQTIESPESQNFPETRQKSQTRIYQEIKLYYENKYLKPRQLDSQVSNSKPY